MQSVPGLPVLGRAGGQTATHYPDKEVHAELLGNAEAPALQYLNKQLQSVLDVTVYPARLCVMMLFQDSTVEKWAAQHMAATHHAAEDAAWHTCKCHALQLIALQAAHMHLQLLAAGTPSLLPHGQCGHKCSTHETHHTPIVPRVHG
jgi:hypothetical protein